MREIEDLYDRTMTKSARTRAASTVQDEPQSDLASQKYRSTVSSISNESFEETKADFPISARMQGNKPAGAMP